MSSLDDEQRALIPAPQKELTIHCIYKGLQLGPTVVLATALPYQLYRSRKNLAIVPILSRVGTIAIYGTITSVAASVLLMHFKLYSEQYNEYKIWDRAYRIRYSQSQQRTDRFALSASVVGGFAGLFLGLPKKFHPVSAGKGALLAVPFGILTHLLIKPEPKK